MLRHPDPPKYIPVAEYDIGVCYYWHHGVPFKIITVKADSLAEAKEKVWKEHGSATQTICHIATRPNPEYVEYTKRYQERSRIMPIVTTSSPERRSKTMPEVTPISPAVVAFVEGCRKIISEHHKAMGYHGTPGKLHLEEGKRYIRVVKETSAYCFIDKTNGDVLKTASWKTPAKHARGSIFDEYGGLKGMGPFGAAYLR